MMFYHVLVETNEKDKNGNNRQYHELDIEDKEKVLEKFAVRHLKGQPLRVYGYLIDNACRFVVTQSELNTETIEKLNKMSWIENRKVSAYILPLDIQEK